MAVRRCRAVHARRRVLLGIAIVALAAALALALLWALSS